jgi:hypothetical protein
MQSLANTEVSMPIPDTSGFLTAIVQAKLAAG